MFSFTDQDFDDIILGNIIHRKSWYNWNIV
jgi:hypothetical protein